LENCHPCGPTGYAVGFGFKYCSLFMQNLENFSDLAQEWVGQTLVCLQEKAFPFMNDTSCSQILNDAFNSHVYCYTQVDPSICAVVNPLRYFIEAN
jgi:hypothetical protein